MLIVRLWGGVGNQLFQYSFGEFLRENFQVDVVYDIASFGKSDKLRRFELLSIVPDIPTTDITFSKFVGVKGRILRFVYTLNNTFIEEANFSNRELQKALNKGDVYLQGYWQNSIYANVVKKKNLFLPISNEPEELTYLKEKIQTTNQSIALHVRRGDYFTSKNIGVFGVCDANYYNEALAYMKNEITESLVFVFSDDLDWVKDNLDLPSDVIYVPNYDISQYWYIYLMSLCKHNVISNSSFSWWGAFLNENGNKIIISPAVWTRNSKETIALNEWVKL